jgi:hypothetical protein
MRVSDLKDQVSTDAAILMCTNCHGPEYSANKRDYFLLPDDYVITCERCDKPLIRAKRVYVEA